MIERLEAAADRSVSRETFEKLECYVNLLKVENQRQNLISASTLDHIWSRHILDSAQLVRFEPRAGALWVDVGSGAGLPGVVIACIVEGQVTLVEPRRRRAEFLAATVKALGLNASVERVRIARITGEFDVITGRAVATLPRFLSMCDHLSTGKTVWALPKGRTARSELAEAQQAWQGVFHVEQSFTDADSWIVVGTGVRAKKR